MSTHTRHKKSPTHMHTYVEYILKIMSRLYLVISILMTAYVFVQNEENTNDERKDTAYE